MDEEFKQFHKTYQMITFALSVGMIYPNPATDRIRLIAIPISVMTITPMAIMVIIDMYYCWQRGDVVNLIRHSTVIGPFLGGFFKIRVFFCLYEFQQLTTLPHSVYFMILMYYKRVQAKQILDEFDRDYCKYNSFTGDYLTIVRDGVKNSLIYSEMGWVITVVTCVMTFPIMAIVLNFYNFTFKFESTKYMIHDVNIPGSPPEMRFESPYFEIIFIYMIYCSILYVINFIGYDGFYGLSINHACMKMDLFCKMMEDAMKAHPREQHQKVVEVIKEQCRMFKFVDLIQDTFNIWLGIIFLATMIQICTCLYHITEGYGFDLRYTIFVTGAIIHIYLPCRYAAKLKAMSAETATDIYCSGWEGVHDPRIRKMVLFMVTRAQAPMQITAFNMIAFDMELFVSIMQTSYSMFTLLRS